MALVTGLTIFIYTLRPVVVESWNLNRTIGWGGELSLYYWFDMISSYTLPIFTIGYALLFFANREVKTILFILYLFIIFLDLFAYFNFFSFPRILFLSWLTFILSVVTSREIEGIEK